MIKYFFTLSISIFMISCAGHYEYHQLFFVEPKTPMKVYNDAIIYEDDNCRISYHLWEHGGDIGFNFYNKTYNNIEILLDETFFVFNDLSFDYYENTILTSTEATTHGSTTSRKNAIPIVKDNEIIKVTEIENSNSTENTFYNSTIHTPPISIIVPAKFSKNVGKFNIMNELYEHPDFDFYPRRNEYFQMDYNANNSPIVFGNVITFKKANSDEKIVCENLFYVKQIVHDRTANLVYTKLRAENGRRLYEPIKVYKKVVPNAFYLFYYN